MRMIDNKLNRIKENFHVFFFIRWQIIAILKIPVNNHQQ